MFKLNPLKLSEAIKSEQHECWKSHPHRAETKKPRPRTRFFSFSLAERVGFEPTKGYKPLPVFKTGAFNRSATSPMSAVRFAEAAF